MSWDRKSFGRVICSENIPVKSKNLLEKKKFIEKRKKIQFF